MTDRRNSIGRIPYDRMQGFGIAEGSFSENGDGYLSDVQTFHSNNPSEVSQDLYHSNRVLEQHFKNKYRFLRNAYEQRIIKLSDVVRVTCENLFTDELLHEMMGEKISSVFIPAHIGEVINHHLESDREQFIHEIISQLSSTKVDLLKCQEALAQKCKAIAILEPEVSRGQRSQSGMDCLQKQHADLKRKFDNLTINSAEKINTMQTKNTILEEQDRTSKENLQKNLSELTLKSSEVESLKGEIAVVTREYSLLETSFERTVNDEVRSKLSSYLSVNNDLSLEVNELKLQIRLKVDELTRTHDALRLKTEEEQSSRSQVTSIMTQVEGMLDDEASESNKTINAIHDKMKLLKSRLSTELQQERKLTAVLQAELGNVRRDKEEEIRQNRLATEESVLLREKLSTEVLKSTSMQAKAQECHNLLMESKARILQAENNSKLITEELANANRLKLQEIKTEVAKARIEALKELEIERSKIDALVASRTAEFKKSYDKQLRTLQNQMRHSYTFGSTFQDYDKMNETHVRNKSLNISHTDDTVNYDENTDSDALAANISMQFAMRKYAEKSTVAKILVESENLIAKAKSEARIENCHQEIVKELQDKLQQAAGNINVLKQMVLRLRGAEDDNTANKQKIIDLLVETRSLEEKVCGYERERSAYDKKIKYFQDEISEQKKDFTDVLSRLSKAERSNSVYESEEKRRNEEQKKTEAEGIKNKHVETLNHEEKLKNDIEKELLEEEKKRNLREKENMANDFHRVSNENLSHVLSIKLLHSQVEELQQELFDIKDAFSNFKTEKSRMEEEDVEEMKKISMVKKEEMKEKAESNEQIMRQEMIMREEKENWYSVEISLRNEIENLKRILQETQTQSLRDQGQDAAALQEMNRKFENLMINYEINVTAVNEKIDSNNSHLQYSDGILVSQKQTIKLLEEKLQQKSGMLQSCSQDLLIECTLKNEEIHRNRTLIEIIVKMKESFQHELRVLNNDLMETRQGVESLVLFFHEEAARLGATFKDVIQGFLEEVSRTHETKVRTIKSALISNHENKMQILESSLTHRIDTLIGEHSEKLNHLQSLSDSQVTTVLNIDDQSMERDDYPRDQSTRNVYGSMIDQSTRNVHSNMIDQSTFEVEESHGSLSASIFSDESPLPAYESVMKGLLAALELSGLLSSSEIQELVSLAAENKEPSLIASSSAQMLLADYLNRLLVDIKESKSEIRHLQKELNFEIHESQLEKDNNALLRERINFSSNPADLSVINSETFCSKAFDIAVEELEQSRNEQSLLLDLARIESDAQIKNLVSQIEELQKQKDAEVMNARTESSEIENILKTSFQEEFEALKSKASEALKNSENEVKYEQLRRQQLQIHLTESESQLLSKIRLLEETNMELQKRADQGDLESTRLKMKILHENISQGL